MKLTKNQAKALKQLNAALRRSEKFMPATVSELVGLGLADRDFSAVSWTLRYFKITDAGRAALAKLEDGE